MTQPTEEQLVARDRFLTGRPIKITAFAGAGKTTTLELLASSRTSRGAYVAFNKSIAAEAKKKFPNTVDCRTTHSIAWHAVQSADRLSSGKMNTNLYPKQLADTLSFRDRVFAGKLRLDGVQQAHLVIHTIRHFCHSAATAISREHVPQYGRLLGIGSDVGWTVDVSKTLWERMINYRDPLPLGHDGYLKLWALGRPKLGFDYILLDEAQDTNPVVLGVLGEQDAQMVYVGDKHQQIYEWRGAVNAMAQIAGCEEIYLTRSFRFGPIIADAASRVLQTLGETRRIRGDPAILSSIGTNGRVGTVLARTNATVILEILEALKAGLKPCVIGGPDAVIHLLRDIFEFKENRPGSCPEFFGFQNWQEVVAFSETEEGEGLRTFVQLVQQHGERSLWKAVKSVERNEAEADIIVSTAHKSKGREWGSVRLAQDFLGSRLGQNSPTAEAEVRLFYVAMTRAKQYLSADPDMLTTFMSGAWKTKKAKRFSTAIERAYDGVGTSSATHFKAGGSSGRLAQRPEEPSGSCSLSRSVEHAEIGSLCLPVNPNQATATER
jgi:UvrD/REP helicase N-terminal domain/UvrD-like helicase C-terminal domain